MASPLAQQGTLNRLRGSITFPDFPALNVTAPFLGPEGINVAFEGDSVENLGTMTGTVTSPAPYQMATVEIELLKSQPLSDQFKQQLETLALIGSFVIRPDTTTLSNYQILNGSIATAGPGRLNGSSVAYMVTLRGYYVVNGALFDAA